MIKFTGAIFIFLTMVFMSPAAWSDFEADLSDTGKPDDTLIADSVRVRAMGGDAEAQLQMGSLYFKGDTLTRDYTEAVKWYRMAVRQGYARAQFNMGMMCDLGLGVAQNHTEAVRWYRAAAQQGLAIAQLNLGVAYADGLGVAQDRVESLRLFLLAAHQGEPQAQFNLSVVYANGQGVTQNFVEAYRWARLAAVQGYEMAPSLAQALLRQMTPEQVASANKLIAADSMNADVVSVSPAKSAVNVPSDSVYLQLAAFRHQPQAEKFRVLLSTKLGDLSHPLRLFTQDDWVSIQIGPYASLSEARLDADGLKGRLGFEPLIKRH